LIILGIIIAGLAATGAIAAVTEGVNQHAAVTLSVFGKDLPSTTVAGVFLVGAATACVFLLGCSLVASGFRRGNRVRRELRDLRDEHDENLQALAAEKAQLERQLARQRRQPGPAGQTQTMPGRPLPGSTAAQPFPGERAFPGDETGPFAPGPGGAPPRPAYPGPGMPPSAVTGQLFRRPDR
jgi:hypothetical protein